MCARTIGAREPRADFKFYVVKFWTFYEGFESPPGKSFAQNYVTIWAKFGQINQTNLGGLLTKLLPGANQVFFSIQFGGGSYPCIMCVWYHDVYHSRLIHYMYYERIVVYYRYCHVIHCISMY